MGSEETPDLTASSFEALNTEMRSNSDIVARLVIVAATGSATVVGFGVQLEESGVFLAAFTILLPAILFVSSQMDSTARIAAYISVKYESTATNVSWETDLMAFRAFKEGSNNYSERPRRWSIRQYELSAFGMFGIIGCSCVVLAFYFLDYGSRRSIIAITVFSVAALGLLFYALRVAVLVSSPAAIEKHRDTWTDVLSLSR